MYIFICVCAYVYVYLSTGRPEVFHKGSSSYFLKQDPSLNLRITDLTRLICQSSPTIFPVSVHSFLLCYDCRFIPPVLDFLFSFNGSLKSELGSPWLHYNHFMYRVTSPNPCNFHYIFQIPIKYIAYHIVILLLVI